MALNKRCGRRLLYVASDARPFRDLVGILFRFRSVDQPEELLQTGWRDDLEDRVGTSPGFQNVCHWPRGLKTRSGAAGFDLMTPKYRCERARKHVGELVLLLSSPLPKRRRSSQSCSSHKAGIRMECIDPQVVA